MKFAIQGHSTREMAEEFLKCFRDLIEKAGDLI